MADPASAALRGGFKPPPVSQQAQSYVPPEGDQGYFAPMKKYGLGNFGQAREKGESLLGDDWAKRYDPLEPIHNRHVPASLTGENVSNTTPNDKGGWTTDVTVPSGEVAEGIEVDSGFGSFIGNNVGFKLTTGEITHDDIKMPDDFNNEAPLNEGQMGIVDQWREQMGAGGSIKAYEPATNMLVTLRPDELAGAMDAGYRFDPATISTEYSGPEFEMPNSVKRDFTPEETANQTVNDPFANFRDNPGEHFGWDAGNPQDYLALPPVPTAPQPTPQASLRTPPQMPQTRQEVVDNYRPPEDMAARIAALRAGGGMMGGRRGLMSRSM